MTDRRRRGEREEARRISSGSVEDAASVLEARLRSGRLGEDALAWASFLSSVAASVALRRLGLDGSDLLDFAVRATPLAAMAGRVTDPAGLASLISEAAGAQGRGWIVERMRDPRPDEDGYGEFDLVAAYDEAFYGLLERWRGSPDGSRPLPEGASPTEDMAAWWDVRRGAFAGDPLSLAAMAFLRRYSFHEYKCAASGVRLTEGMYLDATWRDVETDMIRGLIGATGRPEKPWLSGLWSPEHPSRAVSELWSERGIDLALSQALRRLEDWGIANLDDASVDAFVQGGGGFVAEGYAAVPEGYKVVPGGDRLVLEGFMPQRRAISGRRDSPATYAMSAGFVRGGAALPRDGASFIEWLPPAGMFFQQRNHVTATPWPSEAAFRAWAGRARVLRAAPGGLGTRISFYDPDGALTETGIIGEDWEP